MPTALRVMLRLEMVTLVAPFELEPITSSGGVASIQEGPCEDLLVILGLNLVRSQDRVV